MCVWVSACVRASERVTISSDWALFFAMHSNLEKQHITVHSFSSDLAEDWGNIKLNELGRQT